MVVEERNRDVVWVELGAGAIGARILRPPACGELGRRDRVKDVQVPEREVAAPAIVAPGLLSEAVDGVFRAAAAADGERVVERRVAPVRAGGILRGLHDGAAIRAVDVQSERFQPQRHNERRAAQPNHALTALGLERDALRQGIDTYCERRLLVEDTAAADLHAHDVVAHEIHAQPLAMQCRDQPTVGFLNGTDALESDQLAPLHRAPPGRRTARRTRLGRRGPKRAPCHNAI